MLFFTNALGLNADFKNSNYEVLIPDNYEDVYMSSLHKGVGFNPMDALEKQFRAQGLDEKEPELFKKIVKYRKILEQKETATPWTKICIGAAVACAALFALYKYMYCTKNAPNQSLD